MMQIEDSWADNPCEMCGNHPDNCICPECPVCQAYGDPACYKNHGLICTSAQISGQESRAEEIAMEREALRLMALEHSYNCVRAELDDEIPGSAEYHQLHAEAVGLASQFPGALFPRRIIQPPAIGLGMVRRELKPLGITIGLTRYGELRVNFRGGLDTTAYYTTDLDDALATGKKMAADAERAIRGG